MSLGIYMNHTFDKLLAKIVPFLAIGLFILLFIVGIVALSYLFIVGAIVGLIFFAIAFIRSKFGRKTQKNHDNHLNKGRIIEHE